VKSYNGFTPYQRMQGDRIVKDAIAAGTWNFERKCQLCGLTEADGAYIWVHQEDYTRPIEDARPICVECHMRLHMRYTFPYLWHHYCLALRCGHKPRPWKSNGEFIKAHPFWRIKEAPAVNFEPDPAKWWEMLSVTPQSVDR
jgi:hypothetical protein